MLKKFFDLPIWVHAAATLGALFAFQTIKGRLDSLYAASGHPADFATGQLAFDGEVIKGYYAVMKEKGTLDVYVSTQQFDYFFMLGVAALGLCLGTLIGRFSRDGSWGRRIGLGAAIVACMGACFDALENAVSFVMLAQQETFANGLAIPYSGFAAAKFTMITLAMALLLISMLSAVLGRLLGKPKIG